MQATAGHHGILQISALHYVTFRMGELYLPLTFGESPTLHALSVDYGMKVVHKRDSGATYLSLCGTAALGVSVCYKNYPRHVKSLTHC